MASAGQPISTQSADNPEHWGHSGFQFFNDGVLDHLTDADDRVELDLFDNEQDAVPEFALPLLANEQDLVDKMQATIKNAQQKAVLDRSWDPDSLHILEHRLQATVQSQEPTEQDAQKRNLVLQDINSLVKEGLRGWHGMHVAPYGSFVSGLYTSTGDLDISIEGTRTLGNEAKPCAELEKEEKVQLLKGLARKLNTARPPMIGGKMEYIMHARVPIIKLQHPSGVECDISVASGAARFKSTVLRYLADIDSRFSSLVRLVKLWAGAHGMNDAAAGTFNSFALTLMVTFHLQTQQPPILPPLCQLFQQSQDVLRGRPLHAGQQPKDGVLEACGEVAWTKYHGYGSSNKSTLTQLLASFFVLYHKVVERWSMERSTGLRYVRISTWCGTWTYRPWAKTYCVGVEDPFDCTDNCARTIAPHASSSVAKKFGTAVQYMKRIDSSTVSADASSEGSMALMHLLFTKPPPVEKRSGGRGGRRWGRGRGRTDRNAERPRYLPIPSTQAPSASESSMQLNSVASSAAAATQALQGLHTQQPLSDRPLLTQPPPPPSARQQQQASFQEPSGSHDIMNQSRSSQHGSHHLLPSSLSGQGSLEQPASQQPYLNQGRMQAQSNLPPGLPFVSSQQPSMQSSTPQSSSAELQHGRVQILPARQPRQHQSLDHNVGLQTAGSSGWDHDIDRFNPDAGTAALNGGGFASQHPQQPARPVFEHLGTGLSTQRTHQPTFERSSSGSSAQHAQQSNITGFFQRLNVASSASPAYPSSSQPGYHAASSPLHSDDSHSRQFGQYRAGSSSVTLTDKPQLGVQMQPKQRPYEPHKQSQSPFESGSQGSTHSSGYMQTQAQPRELNQHHHQDGWDTSSISQGYHRQPQADSYLDNGRHQSSGTRDAHANSSAYSNAPTGSDHAAGGYSSSLDGTGHSQMYGSAHLPARSSSGRVLTVQRPSYTEAHTGSQRAVSGSPQAMANEEIAPPPGLYNAAGEPEEMPQGHISRKKEKSRLYWQQRGRGRGRKWQPRGD